MRHLAIELDVDSGVTEGAAADLVDDLRDEDPDLQYEIEVHDSIDLIDGASLVLLVGLALTTAAGSAVIAAFIYRVFHVGVTITCKNDRIRVKKNKELPRGSAYVVHCDGRSELLDGLSQGALTALIKGML